MEVVDFHWRKYYTESTVQEIEDLMDNNDRIFFPFSNRWVRTSQIVSYWPADPETVTLEWEASQLSAVERRTLEASKKKFMDMFEGTKPLSNKRIRHFIALAKKWEVASFGR